MDPKTAATAVSVAMSIFSSIPAFIEAIEKPGNGIQKGIATTIAVEGALNTLPPDLREKIHTEEIVSTSKALRDSIVAINNLAGAFKTNSPQPTLLESLPVPKLDSSAKTPMVGVEMPPDGPVVTFNVSDHAVQAEALKVHIAHIEKRLAGFQAGSAPDKDSRIANLTKNLAEARAELASLE